VQTEPLTGGYTAQTERPNETPRELRPLAFIGCRQEIACRHVLSGKYAIQRIQRKLTAAVQKIGEMGLAIAGLPG